MSAGVFLLTLCLGSRLARAAPSSDVARLRTADEVVRREISRWDEPLPANDPLEVYRRQADQALAALAPRSARFEALRAKLAGAPLVLVGDVHTTARAQANAVRVLREMAAVAGRGPLTVVIEWIDASRQAVIDDFLAGRIPLEQVRRDVRFDQEWPFSWQAYSQILSTARELKVRVLAAETNRAIHELSARDENIARAVADDRGSNPDMRYLVVYGEAHLAGAGHLPDHLARHGLGSPLVIAQELSADIYWRELARVGASKGIETLRLDERTFFLDSGNPLESDYAYYLSLAEQAGDTPRALALGRRLGLEPAGPDYCAALLTKP